MLSSYFTFSFFPFAIALIIAVSHATTFEQLILEEWREFKVRFKKQQKNNFSIKIIQNSRQDLTNLT